MRFKSQWLIALLFCAVPLLASCGAGSEGQTGVADDQTAGKSSAEMPIVTDCESDSAVAGRCMN